MRSKEERRKYFRAKLNLPIEIFLPNTGKRITRITRNISAGGVYFTTSDDETFKNNQKVNIKLALPSSFLRQDTKLKNFDIDATVIRTELIPSNELKRIGVACKFENPLFSS